MNCLEKPYFNYNCQDSKCFYRMHRFSLNYVSQSVAEITLKIGTNINSTIICSHNLLISKRIIIIIWGLHIIFQVFKLKLIIFKLSSRALIVVCACLFLRTTNKHKRALKCIKTILQLAVGKRGERQQRQQHKRKVLIKMFYCNSLDNLWNESFLGLSPKFTSWWLLTVHYFLFLNRLAWCASFGR